MAASQDIGAFLQKITAGTRTNVYTLPSAPTYGQVIRLEAQGSTLRVYYDGSQIGTDQTDSSFATGAVGIFIIDGSSRMDDWEGGNLGTPAYEPGAGALSIAGIVPSMNYQIGMPDEP